MGSCWMRDHINSSKASSWMGDEINRRIPLNYLFICLSTVPNWMPILISWIVQLTFYIPPNLPRALGKGAVSSGIFALTRFLTICFFFYKLPRILTKLGQILQLVSSYKSYQQFDPKRYVGVTGVKSILKIQFYWKCFFSFILDSRGTWFMHIIKLKTLYKTYCLIFLNGVIWGH